MKPVTLKKSQVRAAGGLRAGFLAGLLLAGSLAMAQESAPAALGVQTPDGLTARYPSGSIQSSETANRALVEIEQQRNMLDGKYAAEQQECYQKFFATSCEDAAKERRRVALEKIRKIEIEANAFLRSDRVLQRDKKLAEKRASDAANPPKPLADLPVKQSTQSTENKEKENLERTANREAKLKQKKQDDVNDAAKRAENVTAYRKKVQDAEARQRDVAAKKAEKAKQAAAKAASASAPKTSASAASSASVAPAPATASPPVKP